MIKISKKPETDSVYNVKSYKFAIISTTKMKLKLARPLCKN